MKHVPTYWKPLIIVLASCGLRPAEAAGLRWEDVDFQQHILHVRNQITSPKRGLEELKTDNANRRIPLGDVAIDALIQQWQQCAPSELDLVFPSPLGCPLDSANLRNRVWNPARTAAKLDAKTRIYDLRITFASMLVRQGRSMAFLQYVMGHADPRTTMRYYVGLFEDEVPQAVSDIDKWYQIPGVVHRLAEVTNSGTVHPLHTETEINPKTHNRPAPETMADLLEFDGGSDGARTRDLWLDRPAL